MFDHWGFGVTDCAAGKAFFLEALEPLRVGPDGHDVEAGCHRPDA